MNCKITVREATEKEKRELLMKPPVSKTDIHQLIECLEGKCNG